MSRNGPPPTPIDWDELFRWLEMGYTIHDLAPFTKLKAERLGQRARIDLPPERHEEWKRLVRHNIWAERAPCGTERAFHRHKHLGEPICQVCKDAQNARYRNDVFERDHVSIEVEYKISYQWSKKHNRMLWVVDRHAGKKARLVSRYPSEEAAQAVATQMNEFASIER